MKDTSKPTKKITRTLTSPVMFLTVGFLSSSLVVVAPAVVLQHGHHNSSQQQYSNNKNQQRTPPPPHTLLHKRIYAYGICNTLWTKNCSSTDGAPIHPMTRESDASTDGAHIHPLMEHIIHPLMGHAKELTWARTCVWECWWLG